LLELWIEALDRGAWWPDHDGGWQIDREVRDKWSAARRGAV
jgi:hypothetical protein